MYDRSLFLDTVTGFPTTLVRQGDHDALLADFLERVCAVHTLIGSAVTVAIDGELQFGATPTGDAGFIQPEHDVRSGPCVDAFRSGELVTYGDLRSETHRWPEYADAALGVGVLAGASVPLRFAGKPLGAFSLYADEVRSWVAADLAAALVLADIAAVYLHNSSMLARHMHPSAGNTPRFAKVTPLQEGWAKRAVAALTVTDAEHLARRDRMGLFPAGTVGGDPPAEGLVHAIDGDGSSFCALFTKDDLVRLETASWSGVAPAHRCSRCQAFMSALEGSG